MALLLMVCVNVVERERQ